jgi:hypothetical protein
MGNALRGNCRARNWERTLRFLQFWAMLALFVSAGAAFYELSPPRVRMIDVDAELASRGIDRAHYMSGPSLAEVIQALGDNPDNAIDPDYDPELSPYFAR